MAAPAPGGGEPASAARAGGGALGEEKTFGMATVRGIGTAWLGAGGSGGAGSAAACTLPMCVWRSGLLAAPSWHAAMPKTARRCKPAEARRI